ncbi:UNVERIFIED_CONTAM: hypothetical protein K2H54_004267 [Gekko kuhli]
MTSAFLGFIAIKLVVSDSLKIFSVLTIHSARFNRLQQEIVFRQPGEAHDDREARRAGYIKAELLCMWLELEREWLGFLADGSRQLPLPINCFDQGWCFFLLERRLMLFGEVTVHEMPGSPRVHHGLYRYVEDWFSRVRGVGQGSHKGLPQAT